LNTLSLRVAAVVVGLLHPRLNVAEPVVAALVDSVPAQVFL
jgi:hypothetical protein